MPLRPRFCTPPTTTPEPRCALPPRETATNPTQADLTAEGLRAAVTEVHEDERIRANTARMRETIRNCGGARRGADVIEEYLTRRGQG
nr:hypothetical protein GCM10020241_58450 [Streptoalloteichus tenebrarius]